MPSIFNTTLRTLTHTIFVVAILLGLYNSNTSFAQVYPVIVNTNLRAPYSLNLSDYAAPGYDRITTNLYMSDLTKVNYPVKLRLVIRGEGGINLSTIPGQEVGPIYLNGGQTTTLTGMDINGLFNPEKLVFSGISIQQYRQNSALPEGLYQFQFEVVDYNLGVPISNSNVGVSTAWLILNDPPLINQPERDATIVPLPQQNIMFQWTPRHTGSPNSAFTTVYDLQLVEIYPAGRNANDAMLTSPVIFEKTLYTTSYNYTLADPYLFPGKWYAFRVKAHDVDGRDFFKNQGYSEVYRFYYGGACQIPANIKVTDVNATSAIVSWDLETTHQTTEIEYKQQNASSWKKITSYSNSELIEKLEPRTNYVFKLSGTCANNSSLFSTEVIYTTVGISTGKECDLPLKESVNATASTITDVNVSWLTEKWFVGYDFRYKELGNGQFREVKSEEPSVLLRDLDVDKIYEYQIRYLCKTGVWIAGGFNTFKITVPPDVLVGGGTGDCFAPLDITHEVKKDLTVLISWPKDKEAKSYMVYWKQDVASTSWFSQEVNSPKIVLQNLIPGTDYIYEIKSTCKSGGLSLPSKQGKFNTTYIPIVTKQCNAPKLKPVEVISPEEVKLSWEVDPDHNGYVLEYRVQGSKIWVASKETNPYKLISNLDNTKKYEYHVYAFCGQVSSDFSPTEPFSTDGAPVKQFVCGSGQGLINITNRTPIASLKVGDKFKAADFEMTVKALTSNGPYNGEASAKIPYLKNSSFIFGMENVQVNELGQMYAGKIYMKKTNLSIIDPALAAQITDMLDKVDQGFTYLDEYLATVAQLQDDINGYISAAEGGNNTGKVVTGNVETTHTISVAITNAAQINGTSAGAGQCKLVIAGDNGANETITVSAPSTLTDSKGTIYSIANNCSATKVAESIVLGKSPAELDNLSNKATVTFLDYSSKQKFGFSAWHDEYAKSPGEWGKRYQLLNGSYRVPSKFMEPTSVDVLKASIRISDASIDKNKVIFATGKGVKFSSKSLGGNDYEISIVGGPDKDAQEVYALYPDGASYISLGKVLVPAYKRKKRTLVLVPVNGATANEAKVASTLNKIYNPYGVEWEVKTDANFVDDSWDNNGIEGLSIEGSGAFSTLTDEMAALNKAYRDAPRTIDPTNIYLFVLNKSETSGVTGDMPRGKQFGYLFTENNTEEEIALTAAHEVGHGLFLLRHIFDGYDMTKGTLSENLMDYPLGEKLAKLQWDVMHDPGIVLGVFEKDEDAMAVTKATVVELDLTKPEITIVLPYSSMHLFTLTNIPADFPSDKELLWSINTKNSDGGKYDVLYFMSDYVQKNKTLKVALKEYINDDTLWISVKKYDQSNNKQVLYSAILVRTPLELTALKVRDAMNSNREAGDGQVLYLVQNDKITATAIGKKMPSKFESPDLKWEYYDYYRSYDQTYKSPSDKPVNNVLNKRYYNTQWPVTNGEFTHYISATDAMGKKMKVTIKTLNYNQRSYQMVPASTALMLSSVNEKLKNAVAKPVNKINSYFPGQPMVSIEIDDIKIGGSTNNEEDPDSRFYLIKEEGSISGGIKVETKDIMLPGLSWSVPNVIEIGAYVKFFINGGVAAKIERSRRSDKTTYNPYEKGIEFNLTGGIEAGGKAELLVAKEYVEAKVNIYGRASVTAKYTVNLTDPSNTKGSGQIDPLQIGVNINVKTLSPLEFSVFEHELNTTITNPYPIY